MAVKKVPEGHNRVSPYLIVDGAERALEFYKKAFGAVELFRHTAPTGKVGHAEVRIGDTVVMLADVHPDFDEHGQQQRGLPRILGRFGMKCPRCQAENREGARFCRECGATFSAVCWSCGANVEAGSKFCDGCGASLDAPPASGPRASRFASPESYTPTHLAERILTSKSAMEGERKQVTVLFADLKGSMELLAGRDPEEARKILDPVLDRMIEAVHRYEGTVNQVMGDGRPRSCDRGQGPGSS